MEKELIMSNVVLVCPALSKPYFDINNFIKNYKKVTIINWDILGHLQFNEFKTEVLFIENRIQIQTIPHFKNNNNNVIETCKLILSNSNPDNFVTAYGYNFDFSISPDTIDSLIKNFNFYNLKTFTPVNNCFIRLNFIKDDIPYLLEINRQDNQSILHINVHYGRPTLISNLSEIISSEFEIVYNNVETLIKEVFKNA
ncbi:hypothetical protein [Caloramator sp. Dgby_cultured_2]|uniref:hypothetical protein n=1 Tax=Caloramator sp. Dgby_cultured_2 TaxID=3029174 RepID=UPI00237E9E54|nr:hypothetical protein [Caloramator sp. Dgby_cultured_2]WDU84243.1 hypothetical protein PWK10_07985 [Caloramator sp. Dgby_cultured_2]